MTDVWDFLKRDWLLRAKPTPDHVEAVEFLSHMNAMMGTNFSTDKPIVESFIEWNKIFRYRACERDYANVNANASERTK